MATTNSSNSSDSSGNKLRLSEWAAANGMTENAARAFARRGNVSTARSENIIYVDKLLMDHAFDSDFVRQQDKLQERREKARRKRAEEKVLFENAKQTKPLHASSKVAPADNSRASAKPVKASSSKVKDSGDLSEGLDDASS